MSVKEEGENYHVFQLGVKYTLSPRISPVSLNRASASPTPDSETQGPSIGKPSVRTRVLTMNSSKSMTGCFCSTNQKVILFDDNISALLGLYI